MIHIHTCKRKQGKSCLISLPKKQKSCCRLVLLKSRNPGLILGVWEDNEVAMSASCPRLDGNRVHTNAAEGSNRGVNRG